MPAVAAKSKAARPAKAPVKHKPSKEIEEALPIENVMPRSKGSVLDIMSKTMALLVKFHKFGNQRKVPTSQVDVHADKTWISVSKKLIESPELVAILALDGEVRRYLDTRALPSLLAKGIYLLPIPFVEEVNKRLKEFAGRRDKLVEAFAKVYEKAVASAKESLDQIFDDSDYPEVAGMRAQFYLKWQYISFSTPASLQQINSAIFEEEKQKAEGVWREATDTIKQLLRADMSDLVSHLVDKLTPTEDGKKKKFHDTALTKITEFLATFEARNVTDDEQLKKIISDAKKLVANVPPDALRSEEITREIVRKGFEQIKNDLAPLIVDKPTRKISFED